MPYKLDNLHSAKTLDDERRRYQWRAFRSAMHVSVHQSIQQDCCTSTDQEAQFMQCGERRAHDGAGDRQEAGVVRASCSSFRLSPPLVGHVCLARMSALAACFAAQSAFKTASGGRGSSTRRCVNRRAGKSDDGYLYRVRKGACSLSVCGKKVMFPPRESWGLASGSLRWGTRPLLRSNLVSTSCLFARLTLSQVRFSPRALLGAQPITYSR